MFLSLYFAVNIVTRVVKSVHHSRTNKRSRSVVEGLLECLSITAALFGYIATIFGRPVHSSTTSEESRRGDDMARDEL